MKKLFLFSSVIFTILFFSIESFAQNEKRYTIEMSVTVKGNAVKVPLSSAGYSITRDTDDQDTSYSRQRKFIYYSIVAEKRSKELLLMMQDKKSRYDIAITVTDNYGKLPKQETLLKKAAISSVSESYTPYNYDYSNSVSISIVAASMVVDGVEIEP